MRDGRVVVVGGGLAGIAAALHLADAGASVTLLESRTRLGGATFSVRRNGYWLDNGQHVALRCCTAYRTLLRRLGVERSLDLQPRLRIPVLAPGRPKALISRTALPAPLHLTASLLRYRHLGVGERLAAFRAAAALRTLDPGDTSLDDETFGAWLRAHGQSERAISALWNLIALPTLNLDAEQASLLGAAKVFRTGLLDESDACDIGVPRVPLQHLHGDPAEAALRGAGARVELGCVVRRITPTGARLEVEMQDATLEADVVVVAVPHQIVAKIVPYGVVDEAATDALGESPIVNLHLHYDRRVLDEPFAAAIESPVQWLFDRTASSGVENGQLVSVSLSGADAEVRLSREEIASRLQPAVEHLLPAAGGATLLDMTVTKEPRATFRATPGTAVHRPGTRTPVPGLYLAGAWTDTGWPATMEGAVLSGVAAARAALGDGTRRARAGSPLEAAA